MKKIFLWLICLLLLTMCAAPAAYAEGESAEDPYSSEQGVPGNPVIPGNETGSQSEQTGAGDIGDSGALGDADPSDGEGGSVNTGDPGGDVPDDKRDGPPAPLRETDSDATGAGDIGGSGALDATDPSNGASGTGEANNNEPGAHGSNIASGSVTDGSSAPAGQDADLREKLRAFLEKASAWLHTVLLPWLKANRLYVGGGVLLLLLIRILSAAAKRRRRNRRRSRDA